MFETALVASKNSSPFRNAKLLPIAFLAHGLALAGIVSANYWSVDEIPDPIGIVFYSPEAALPEMPKSEPVAPQPPAPPPPDDSAQPPVVPPVDSPPTTIEDLPPISDAPVVPVVVDSGGSYVPGSLPSDGPGCPGCIGTEPSGSDPVQVFPGMTPPEVMTRVMPKYTEAARRARVEGIVILEAIIDMDGTVRSARVTKSLPMGLDREAIAAVEQWKFRPASYAGRKRAVYFTLTVRFSLQ